MAWETKGRCRYYTRSVREGGKVKRQYLGSGPLAESIASLDAVNRQRREIEQNEKQAARQAGEDSDRLIRWYCRFVEGVLHSEMMAAGFHQHDRGQWRKRRQTREGNSDMMMQTMPQVENQQLEGERVESRNDVQRAAMAELERRQSRRSVVQSPQTRAQAIEVATVPETKKERGDIIFAAMNGNEALEAQAMACIRAFPAETVLGWGNPKEPCLSLVSMKQDTPRSRVLRACIEQEFAQKLKQVMGDSPTPLERLLAERITVLRFQITHFEREYEIHLGKGMSADMSQHHMKRIERLDKQYLRAIESLARVRRLQLPTVNVGQVNGQLNIAETQLNVGGVGDFASQLPEIA